MMAQASRTLGSFNVPTSLPSAEFDLVNEWMAKRSSGTDDIWYSFATAWNANPCSMYPVIRDRRNFTKWRFIPCSLNSLSPSHVSSISYSLPCNRALTDLWTLNVAVVVNPVVRHPVGLILRSWRA